MNRLVVTKKLDDGCEYVELSPTPGWQDDGLYALEFVGSSYKDRAFLVERCKVRRKDGALRRYINVGILRCEIAEDDDSVYRVFRTIRRMRWQSA